MDGKKVKDKEVQTDISWGELKSVLNGSEFHQKRKKQKRKSSINNKHLLLPLFKSSESVSESNRLSNCSSTNSDKSTTNHTSSSINHTSSSSSYSKFYIDQDDYSTSNSSTRSNSSQIDVFDTKPPEYEDNDYSSSLASPLSASLSASLSKKKEEEEQKKSEKKHFIMEKTFEELINTEVQYISSLDSMINNYMSPLVQFLRMRDEKDEENAGLNGGGVVGNTPSIDCAHSYKMLMITETIHENNKHFLGKLLKYDKQFDRINAIFHSYEKCFNLYPTFVHLYEKYVSILEDPAAMDLIKKLEEKHSDRLGFRSCLLKPIQRLSKYKLLLENMKSNWNHPPIGSRYGNNEGVDRALNSINEILDRCDTVSTLQTVKHNPFRWRQTGNTMLVLDEDAKLVNFNNCTVRVFVFERVVLFASKHTVNSKSDRDSRLDNYIYKGAVYTRHMVKVENVDARVITLEDYEASKGLLYKESNGNSLKSSAVVKWQVKLSTRRGFEKLLSIVDRLLWKQHDELRSRTKRQVFGENNKNAGEKI